MLELATDSINVAREANSIASYACIDAPEEKEPRKTASFSDGSFSFPRLGTSEFERYSKSLDTRSTGYKVLKRAFDILFSVCVILASILFLPLTICLLIVIAVQTKASPIYVQERVGRYGKPMRIFKLRSMVRDSDNVEKYFNDEQLVHWRKERKVPGDSRVVPIGRFIRRTSFDEFANVLNVLEGEMSVIGPRPISYEEMRWFTPEEQAVLLSIPGGITGLWQATSRNDATFESGERQSVELEYVRSASIKTDWSIFKKTFRAIFSGTGK